MAEDLGQSAWLKALGAKKPETGSDEVNPADVAKAIIRLANDHALGHYYQIFPGSLKAGETSTIMGFPYQAARCTIQAIGGDIALFIGDLVQESPEQQPGRNPTFIVSNGQLLTIPLWGETCSFYVQAAADAVDQYTLMVMSYGG